MMFPLPIGERVRVRGESYRDKAMQQTVDHGPKSMLKYLDYLFLTRPVLMPPVWTILLLGHRRSAVLSGGSHLPGLAVLLVTFLVGAVYVLNQVCDIESDRLNNKLFFLAQGLISKRSALVEMIVLNLAAIIPAFLISLQLGLLFVLGALFGFLYSVRPFALKNKPIGGLITNALAHGSLAFLIGWSMNRSLSAESLIFSLPYFLAVAAVYLNTTVPDLEGDRATGKITFAVRWGRQKTTVLSFLLVISAVVLSLVTGDTPFLVASALSLPFFLFAGFNRKERAVALSTKASILFLSVAAGFFYPWYFVILILGFAATRLYYRARFAMNYPALI
jgi:4-hydroxybenzoate polyprenyltransferase